VIWNVITSNLENSFANRYQKLHETHGRLRVIIFDRSDYEPKPRCGKRYWKRDGWR
jgi:hypothetical protein